MSQASTTTDPSELDHRQRSFKESDGGDHIREEDVFAGFNNRDRQAQVVLTWQAEPHDKIKHCSFVDDERPHYIFIILENQETHH